MTATGKFAIVTDGLSNALLTVETSSFFCYGANFPRTGATPNLSTGSFTFSIGHVVDATPRTVLGSTAHQRLRT